MSQSLAVGFEETQHTAKLHPTMDGWMGKKGIEGWVDDKKMGRWMKNGWIDECVMGRQR